MARQMLIFPTGGAPFAQQYSATGSGGTGWPGTALSFLVVGWDSADESDYNFMRPVNFYMTVAAILGQGPLNVTEVAVANVTPGATDTVTLNWTPPRRQPHHYSIYRMAGASFLIDGTGLGLKVLPALAGLVAGNIPGNATSAVITDATSRVEGRSVPVYDSAPDKIYLPGNRTHSFLLGSASTQVSITGAGAMSGAYAISACELVWTDEGELTELTLAGTGGQTCPRGARCVYELGRITRVPSFTDFLTLSLDREIALSEPRAAVRGFDGRMYPASYLNFCPWQRLSFDLATGGISAQDLGILNKWGAIQRRVGFFDLDEGGESKAYTRFYYGTLHGPTNNPGTASRWGESIMFSMDLDRVQDLGQNRGFHVIVAVGTGAGGTFEIAGHHLASFPAGRGFMVINSTNNNGPWAVASASYSDSTHRTTITVTGTVGATADGRIEVQEW